MGTFITTLSIINALLRPPTYLYYDCYGYYYYAYYDYYDYY